MSCAVMFQPCLAAENLSLPNAKSDSTLYSFNTILPITPSPIPSVNIQHPTEIFHSQHLSSDVSGLRLHSLPKMSRHSPPVEEETPRHTFKKLCTSHRDSYSSPIPNQQSQHNNTHKQHSPASTPNHVNESDVKYVSANCVVVTHYRGDTSAVVDEHFSRALAAKPSLEHESHMKVSSKSFPPSFYQPHMPPRTPLGMSGSLATHSSADLYEAYHGSLHSIQATGADSWAYPFSTQAYAHRSMGHDVYHSAMASASNPYQYSTLGFQQPFSRLPSVPVPTQMNKSDGWGARYYDSFVGTSAELASGLEGSSYSSSHYHNTSGIENGIAQECTKDLYWL